LDSQLTIFTGVTVQPFGAVAVDSFPETYPAQDQVPENDAKEYPPEEENNSPVPGSIHGGIIARRLFPWWFLT
jgi:hypothetical protein